MNLNELKSFFEAYPKSMPDTEKILERAGKILATSMGKRRGFCEACLLPRCVANRFRRFREAQRVA